MIHLNDRLDIDETRVAMSMRIYFRSSLARPRQFHYRVIHIAKVSAAWISLKKESYAQEAEAGNQKTTKIWLRAGLKIIDFAGMRQNIATQNLFATLRVFIYLKVFSDDTE